MTLSDNIKATLPLVEEFQRDGHDLRKVGSRFVTKCPFHRERTPSCCVSPNKGRFHCFGCGVDGSVIDYHVLKRGITPAEAIAELALRIRISPASPDESNRNQPAKPKVPDAPRGPRALPKLPDLHKGDATELATLAEVRRLSLEALRLASSRGLLYFCKLNDGPEAVRAWILTDRTRKNAQTRRLDGERWRHAWDADAKQWAPVEVEKRNKVRGFVGNQARWPVGIEEAQRFNSIALLEGVDLIAAFHFLIAEAREDAVGPVAMLGASNRIPNDVLNLFAGKRVRMFPHADAAGLRAAANWEAQLRPVVESIDAFDFAGLLQTGGKPVLDLNDLTNVDCDCLEAEPAVLSMMNF
jgi:CHC2-type zinc finger protein